MKIPVYRRAELGGWTEVDAADYPDLINWLWHISANGYVYRNLSGGGTEYMHRRVLGIADPAIHTDHINGVRLDNRLANLRAVSQAENNQNVRSSGASKYRGVSYVKEKRKWRVQVSAPGFPTHVGYFDNEHDAARAAADARAERLPFTNPERDGLDNKVDKRGQKEATQDAA